MVCAGPGGGDRAGEEVGTASIRLRFYAELSELLAPGRRGREFTHICPAGNAVKDVVEGLGVPHTEVDLILVNGNSVDLGHQIADGDRISVYPVFESLDIGSVTAVRAHPLRVTRFAADVHLGRLAGYLRLAGFDTLYRNDWSDDALTRLSVDEGRIVLTRDRGLLKRAIVTHGYLVRNAEPRAQLTEVLRRFDLWRSMRLFSRCSVCNGVVEPVERAEVAASVTTRTLEHHQDFWRCSGCRRVYWQGAHYRSLLRMFDQVPTGEEGDAQDRDHPHRPDA